MTTTYTFVASDLRRCIANAALFAAPYKDCQPGLSVVRFEFDEGHLLALATNRYVLSWEVVQVQTDVGSEVVPEPFSLRLSDVKRVLAMLPKTGAAAWATVEYDPDDESLVFDCHGESIRTTAEGAEFPRCRIRRDGFKAADKPTVVLASEYLALLAKVDDGTKCPVLHFELAEGNKPMRISIGETFRALLVPIRNAG